MPTYWDSDRKVFVTTPWEKGKEAEYHAERRKKRAERLEEERKKKEFGAGPGYGKGQAEKMNQQEPGLLPKSENKPLFDITGAIKRWLRDKFKEEEKD